MITIFNPTNEFFKPVYAGIDVPLKPNEKKVVEDACANHLLNSFGQRGLCQLIYGDNEEDVAKKGRERNYEFKKEQVRRFNVMNEQRKMSNMGYLRPTEEIKRYSVELGIGLLEPYNLKEPQLEQLVELKRENEELKKQMAEIISRLKMLPENKEIVAVEPEPQPETGSEERRKPGRPRKVE